MPNFTAVPPLGIISPTLIPVFDPTSTALRPAGGMEVLGPYPVKRWNFTSQEFLPPISDIPRAACSEPHCGLIRQTTASLPVLPPGSMTDPNFPFIGSRVEHRVTTPGAVPSLFPFPVWDPRFEAVEATTVASYSHPVLGTTPQPTATAAITSTD